jgi:hypothetical protein
MGPRIGRGRKTGGTVAGETVRFSATQREAGDGAPGATAAFPYDRMTVERFRAWFVPGRTAERRLTAWSGREWTGVLAHADERGRDAFAFEPVESPYLETTDDLVVRTPYSRAVVAELRAVPWARWDPASKAWRVPFRSLEELRRRWPAIEDAARRAEPAERRKREADRNQASIGGQGTSRHRPFSGQTAAPPRPIKGGPDRHICLTFAGTGLNLVSRPQAS